MVKKLINVVKGTWRNFTNYESDLTKHRRDICKKCSHNIKFMGTRICDQCGCVIDSKTTIENEKCKLNKW